MRRIIFASLMAIIFFVVLNFVYCNLDGGTFGYQVVFKFKIPYIMTLYSVPLPLGFVLLLTFCLGMVVIALLEALPGFYKFLELRAKNKRIRQLERELEVARKTLEEKSSDQSSVISEQ